MVSTLLSHPHIWTTRHFPTLTLILHNISMIVIYISVIKIGFWDLTPTEVRELQKLGFSPTRFSSKNRPRAIGLIFWEDVVGRSDRRFVMCAAAERGYLWRAVGVKWLEGANFAQSSCSEERSPRGDSLQELTHPYSDHFSLPSISLSPIPLHPHSDQISKKFTHTQYHSYTHIPPNTPSPSRNSQT